MALPASDTFNRADSGSLGSNWTEIHPPGGVFTISSNAAACSGTGSGDHCAYWNADAFANDHYSAVVIAVSPTFAGPAVRCSGDTSSGNSYHLLGSDTHTWLQVGTTVTSLGSWGGSAVAGDTLKLSAVGTAVTINLNGSDLANFTDATLSSGSSGIAGYNGSGKSDSWTGDSIPSGANRRWILGRH